VKKLKEKIEEIVVNIEHIETIQLLIKDKIDRFKANPDEES
jgi:hypothetical protein